MVVARKKPGLKNMNQILKQAFPKRANEDELHVWPWMGILVNISRRRRLGIYAAITDSELKAQFSEFRPTAAVGLSNREGHLGVAVFEFEMDVKGYEDARAFDRIFFQKRLGKKEWKEKKKCRDSNLYGWLAEPEDFMSKDDIGSHLREKADLKTLSQIREVARLNKVHIIENLRNAIAEDRRPIEACRKEISELRDKVATGKFASEDREDNKQMFQAYDGKVLSRRKRSERRKRMYGDKAKELQMLNKTIKEAMEKTKHDCPTIDQSYSWMHAFNYDNKATMVDQSMRTKFV